MIRLILCGIFLLLFFTVSLPLFFIEWLIGLFNPYIKGISSLRIVQWAFKVLIFISGVDLTVIGEENVPKDTPVLYVGNHRSYFDTILTYARVPRQTSYIAKKETAKIPILKRWMLYLHCLFLDRDDIKQGLKVILTAIDYIKEGISVCIFPEGTRNHVDGTFMEFHEGSFKVATKSNCPIIPMSIINSAEIFENHMPKIKKAHVILIYGEPIYPDQIPPEQKKKIGQYCRNIIIENYHKYEDRL